MFLVLAIWQPTSYSSLLNIGLALLVSALFFSVWRHYFLRSPVPTRYGHKITIDRHPVAYRLWFILISLFCGFVFYVLLRNGL